MAWRNNPPGLAWQQLKNPNSSMVCSALARGGHLFAALATTFLLLSCGEEHPTAVLTTEVDMLGNRHDLRFSGDSLIKIEYTTFIPGSETDSTKIDTVIRRDVDSLVYGSDGSLSLFRNASRHSVSGKIHRRYYFNADNLLTRITRFSGNSEYTTDSIVYDYTTLKVGYYDLINHELDELEYDRDNNITSIVERRTGTNQVISTTYNYFTESRDPFLINLTEDEQLFGCFQRKCVGLFWNGGMRPLFRSVNNVQATKQIRNKEETNALYEYHSRDGLPVARYGGYGVVFYRYAVRK
jgi:hypothetical protein